jgi:hypothetical protein
MKVNFTLLLQPGYWFHGQEAGSNETWAQELARYVSYMRYTPPLRPLPSAHHPNPASPLTPFRMPNYQTVTIAGDAANHNQPRPLVFSFGRPINQSHLKDFRDATKSALGVYPYFVSMNNQEIEGMIDAQSAYGGGHSAPNGSDFVTHLAEVEKEAWARRAEAGTKQIPTVSAGNDDRPRSEYPMPWGPRFWSSSFVRDPTMAQLAAHVSDGLEFVREHPSSAEANMLLLSAWNEHDEVRSRGVCRSRRCRLGS